MKIRPLKRQPQKPVSLLVDRLQKCGELVRAYHKARVERNLHAAHAARLEISLFVPGGVYTKGGDTTGEHFAVYGIILRPGKRLVSPEQLFVVPVIPIREVRQHVEIVNDESVEEPFKKWTVPLIDTEGFLTPVCKDGYHGERFVRVGEVVHY
jgi:hypothetical protein